MGDPFALPGHTPNQEKLYGSLNKSLEKKVLLEADKITVTTAATRALFAEMYGEAAVQKVQLVPPLWQAVQTGETVPVIREKNNEKRRMGYFGALYAPERTPDLLLQLWERTLASDPVLADGWEVHFYGELFPEFYAQLQRYPAFHLHGLRSRAECEAAMQDMDLLLNLGNTVPYMLPSKVVDYLASGKAVLHLSPLKSDPFAEMFENSPRFLPLVFENKQLHEAAFQQWLHWLRGGFPPADTSDKATRMADFTVEKIGSLMMRN